MKYKNIKNVVLHKTKPALISLLFFVSNIGIAFADLGASSGSQGGLENPLGSQTNSIPLFLQRVLIAATEIGAIVGALSIMYGGYLYATAQGDEEKLQKAKTTVTWAIVGTAVLIGAQIIIAAVVGTVKNVIS